MENVMEWYEEWNDLQNVEMILMKSETLSEQNKKSYLKEIIQTEKLLFKTVIGKTFLKEYKIIVSEALEDSFNDFLDDIKMMQKIIKLGIYSEDDIWEMLFAVLEKKQKIRFNTSLGKAFLELYAQKIKLEKDTDYKNLQYDVQQIEKIYKEVDFDNLQRTKKIALELTDKEERIFNTWLGHNFVIELQNQYLSKEKIRNARIRKFSKFLVYMLLCGVISFVSIGLYIKFQANKKYNDLQQKKAVIEETGISYEDITSKEMNENLFEQEGDKELEGNVMLDKPEVLEEYQEIAAEYPDFVGWITIPDTTMDYPVMQSLDDEYYLNHDYTGEPSLEGSIFIDAQSNISPLDNVVVVYGHNMKNGDMFGVLDSYETESYLKEHKIVHFDTKYEKRKYEIVAVLKTHIMYQEEDGFRYYQTFGYQTEEEFQEIVDFMKQNKLYDMKEEIVYGDKLLMLSTCEYSQENGRLVVVGRNIY